MNDLRKDWSEKKLQTELIARAHELGWMVMHSRGVPIRRADGTTRHATPISGDVGYPDLTLVRVGRVAFLELKSERGNVTDEQAQWLGHLCNGPVMVEDWRSRGDTPDGAALHVVGGWNDLDVAGDWMTLVAVIRPRHYDWTVRQLALK